VDGEMIWVVGVKGGWPEEEEINRQRKADGKAFENWGTPLATKGSSVQVSVGKFPEKTGDTISDENIVGIGLFGEFPKFFVKLLKNSLLFIEKI
jgi:hypothetical protein